MKHDVDSLNLQGGKVVVGGPYGHAQNIPIETQSPLYAAHPPIDEKPRQHPPVPVRRHERDLQARQHPRFTSERAANSAMRWRMLSPPRRIHPHASASTAQRKTAVQTLQKSTGREAGIAPCRRFACAAPATLWPS